MTPKKPREPKVLAAGCDDFLRKPFKNADIFELMHIGVRYIYEEPTTEPAQTETQELTPASLQVLSPKLLAQLEEAMM
jgi:FixJ family two-component response regulator